MVVPLLVAAACFSLNGVNTSPDSAHYLSTALNLYHGAGYVDTSWSPILNRGPVFPGLIAASFFVFGPSVEHAFWVVRLFFVLNPMLLYFTGKHFWGRTAGLGAALLALTSFTIARWSSYLLLDNVVPFFVLFAVLATFLALETGSRGWFLATGLSLGLGFLTKEVVLLYFPLPFLALLLIRSYRDQLRSSEYRRGFRYLAAGILVLVGPWAAYVYLTSGNLSWLIGRGAPIAMDVLTGEGGSGAGPAFGAWLLDYYNSYLDRNFAIAPIMAAGWGFTAFRGTYSRDRASGMMLLALVLFIPVILLQGGAGWRAGQSMVVYMLSFLAVSHLIVVGGGMVLRTAVRVSPRTPHAERVLQLVLVVLLLAVVLFQVNDEGKMRDLWDGERVGSTYGMDFFTNEGFTRGGWHTSHVRHTGGWIDNNLPSDSKVMCDWYWRSSLAYYSNRDGVEYRYFHIPYIKFPFREGIKQESDQYGVGVGRGDPLFIWSHRNRGASDTYLRVLSQEQLLQHIEESGIEFVVVTFRRNFLSLYFEQNPGFEKVRDTGRIKIYRVNNPEPIEFTPRTGTMLTDYLENVERDDPEKYISIREDLFVGGLSFTEEEIDSIENGELDAVDVYRVY